MAALLAESAAAKLPDRLGDLRLQPHQQLAMRYFLATRKLRSMLLCWGTGLGKTVAALYAMKNVRRCYPDVKLVLLIKASLREDPWLRTMRTHCPELIPRVTVLTYDHPAVMQHLRSALQAVNWRFTRVLVVVDEVHKFISRNLQHPAPVEYVADCIFEHSETRSYTSRVLALSATPLVNDLSELPLLMRLLRPGLSGVALNLFLNPAEHTEALLGVRRNLAGLASVRLLDARDPLESSPATEAFAEKRVLEQSVTMSRLQGNLLLEAAALDSGLLTYQRLVGNIAFEDLRLRSGVSDAEYREVLQKLTERFNESVTDEAALRTASEKYWRVAELAARAPGKCAIYCTFVRFEGVRTLGKYLEHFGVSYTVFDKDSRDVRFNSRANQDGALVKAMVFTNKGAEGVSFTYVNDLFLVDVPWNVSMLRQVIGRGLRMGSHRGSQRYYINVHLMVAYTESGYSLDLKMLDYIRRKEAPFTVFMDLLQQASLETVGAADGVADAGVLLRLDRAPVRHRATVEARDLRAVFVDLDGVPTPAFYDPVSLEVFDEHGLRLGQADLGSARIADGRLMLGLLA